MTPESQRIAIAEACPNHILRTAGDKPQWMWSTGDGFYYPCHDNDPLNDLNAIQSAVLSQNDDFITRFALEMNKAENRMHKYQWAMSAQDYSDCFISAWRTLKEDAPVSKDGKASTVS